MASHTLNNVELVPLLDGAQDLHGPIQESFPSVPAEAWTEVHSTHPELVSATGTWRLHVRCTLIKLPARTILVDTGVGQVVAPTWFGGTGRLVDELGAADVDPGAIDTVVLTHVHDDHMGGTVRRTGELAFPNARYVLQRADLEWQQAWAEREEEDRVLYDALLRPLEEAGALVLVDGDTELAEGVRIRHAPGHTPGHQMVEVHHRDERVLISGDAFNHPVQLVEPEWFGSSDDEPDTANATRRALVEELAGSQMVLAPSHFADPFGRVRLGQDGRAGWVPRSHPRWVTA